MPLQIKEREEMELEKLLEEPSVMSLALAEKPRKGAADLTRAAQLEIARETYLEAQNSGMTLSELLETEPYDPSPVGSALDAFERQLIVRGLKVEGKNASTVEEFFAAAPVLMPEFIRREILRGQRMRPGLETLIATSTPVFASRYTPFYINVTPAQTKLSLKPVGEGAFVPQMLVTEQQHTITVPEYGLALAISYRALRYRSMAQFKVLLWYVGFRLSADKIGLLVNTIINGDGNSNPATVINTAVTGTLAYTDLVTFWNEFYPFEMNTLVMAKDKLKTVLTLAEFKDPMVGFRFQKTGELVTPLGTKLIRSDDAPTDLLIGLDNRFAIEEVVSQPLLVEFDKVIEQRLEEAVVSEAVAYAKVVKEASLVLDVSW